VDQLLDSGWCEQGFRSASEVLCRSLADALDFNHFDQLVSGNAKPICLLVGFQTLDTRW
jgi:hypothetical protein